MISAGLSIRQTRQMPYGQPEIQVNGMTSQCALRPQEA